MNCRNLEELELSGVTDVTDDFLISLAEICSGSLQSIGLKGCRQVGYFCAMFLRLPLNIRGGVDAEK
jgi:hypothetical protein